METRRLTVDNLPVVVLDDAITDPMFGEFVEFITSKAAFTLSQSDTQESLLITGPYWAYKIPAEVFKNTIIYKELKQLTSETIANLDWNLLEAYVNANQYGDNSYIHKDNNTYTNSATCLVYLNETWKPDFAGETIFYNNCEDAELVVSPKFKRITIFDGKIIHRASPPSRICPLKRLVLVVKFGVNGEIND
jgi:Rps23 Pro-64 3,4-dihydroxylase Tpa1-like proline 4-hydroxylase